MDEQKNELTLELLLNDSHAFSAAVESLWPKSQADQITFGCGQNAMIDGSRRRALAAMIVIQQHEIATLKQQVASLLGSKSEVIVEFKAEKPQPKVEESEPGIIGAPKPEAKHRRRRKNK